ncbi:MAG: polyprenol monophosphomannose synthase [Gemmataceae bacterium]|nr:polyprenol monophosphomannose synthase [Gemmataceae bacterium]
MVQSKKKILTNTTIAFLPRGRVTFGNSAGKGLLVEIEKNPSQGPEGKVLVSTATYNEKDNLKPLVEEIRNILPQCHILVIDDNSPDGTGELADQLARDFGNIHVIHRAGKQGLGTAILAGMKFALENDFYCFINMDADFSHDPKYLPFLYEGMAANDVMIGSRYVPGGGTENWPASRKFMSANVNRLVRFLFGMPVKDASGGYRAYKVDILRKANLENVKSRGYSFQQEVLFRCFRAGAKIGEHPILFANRRAGSSKVSMKEVIRSLSLLTWLGIKAKFSSNP